MLLTVDGFKLLIDKASTTTKTVGFDLPWHKLWREFQLDARRFDGATLLNITGSPAPISINDIDPNQFTERGLKIAGEFLRQHHHRIAHEIAIHGFPSLNGRVQLFNNIPQHFREMAGLIGRSHGMDLRNCLEILITKDKTSHRAYRHIHPTFLMVLVRLADYLDLDDSRAPSTILETKTLKSPISKREWWAHKAIVDCHSLTDDPECLQIVVDPTNLPNVSTYGAIEDKVIGIQKELDSCWAIIGEVYGRFPPLNNLSLKIRRIRSDINLPSITQQLPFVTHRATLESARADLLKLLIEPLYGDNPGIGIRELLQNALDAVRERAFYTNTAISNDSESDTKKSDVAISFEKEDDSQWVVIDDHGIGMTWQTVCKCYLTAGASFRHSDNWKRKFTNEEGNSQILRSGRFGVGVLAAFLVGDHVRISTRHIDQPEDKGIEFEFSLNDTIIEMRWVSREIGTTVKIKSSEAIIEKLNTKSGREKTLWDWYCFTNPVVTRKSINGKKFKQRIQLPGPESKLPLNWHRVEVPNFQGIDWSYQKEVPGLICNGIIISDDEINLEEHFTHPERSYKYSFERFRYDPFTFHNPSISVFDADGCLPLNLSRDSLASPHSELEEKVAKDICKNYTAYLLKKGPCDNIFISDNYWKYIHTSYIGIKRYRYQNHSPACGYLFSTSNGFGLATPVNLSSFAKTTGLLLKPHGYEGTKSIVKNSPTSLMEEYSFILGGNYDDSLGYFDSWHKSLSSLAVNNGNGEDFSAFKDVNVKGIRVIIKNIWHERLMSKQPNYVKRALSIETSNDKYTVWTIGACEECGSSVIKFADELSQKSEHTFQSITEVFMGEKNTELIPIGISKLWKELFGTSTIPYDDDARMEIIETLKDDFNQHISEWSEPSTL